MSLWDDPGMQPSEGNFMKFENIGDSIQGEIVDITKQTWPDGKTCAQLVLDTGNGVEKTVTCGQVRLKAALAEKRPNIGDLIKITYTMKEPRPGGKTLKHFEVLVKQGKTSEVPGTSFVASKDEPASFDQVLTAVNGPSSAAPF